MGVVAAPPPPTDSGTCITARSETNRCQPREIHHKTVRGDTLWEISNHILHNPLRWKEIAEDNRVTNHRKLPVGITLTINLHPNLSSRTPTSGPIPSPGVKKTPSKKVTPSPKASWKKSSSASRPTTSHQKPTTSLSSVAARKAYARSLVPASQWDSLNKLIERESGWNPYARNPSSGAYGIPQALPGRKMAAAGADWETNPATQLRWMINIYIPQRYGTPNAAWAHFKKNNWY